MTDERIRQKIHRAVDVHGAALRDDPFLASRIISMTHRKELPRMKKLSTGMIIAIILMLLSVTALAVGLTVEEVWQQTFSRMGTWGEVWNIGTPTEKDLTMDEAAAIARKELKAKFGVTDGELDAMGFYPSYFEAEVDDGIPYPSSWRFLWSSRTNVDLDLDYDDYGPNGEYRVYMHGETGEIDTCIFYTNNFWDYAQRVWDVGNYDEVYWRYNKTDYFNMPAEQQAYWTDLLAEKGYTVRDKAGDLHQALRSAHLDLQFCDLNQIADNDDPLVAAAWAALEKETGLRADLLQKYAYVATVSKWNTGYDDVCIHFSYAMEGALTEAGYLDQYSDWMFSKSNNLGMYMVSFEKGTTDVAAVTHVTRSESVPEEPVTEGPLLVRNNWNADDFIAFDAEYARFDRAVKRMRAAKLDGSSIDVVVRDYFRRMGVESEYYPAAPEEANVMQWFADESEWDAHIKEPEMPYEEFAANFGTDRRFWPQEVLMSLDPGSYRMPNEGELTFDEALRRGLDQLAAEYGVTDLSGYTVNVRRVSLTADPNQVDCRWEVNIADDPFRPTHGWKIHFGEWEDHIDTPHIQDILDPSNG